ncbi:MAG: imelysin family protein [Pseudomonadota bacterium]
MEGRAADAPRFKSAVENALDRVIIPNYATFMGAPEAMERPVRGLCEAPSLSALDNARAAFAKTVLTWSRVEMFRFGPAHENNRFEKLFYWPDRKGRGLRQVQAILAEQNETAKPKRAPFWRSNLTAPSSGRNLDGVEALFDLAINGLLSKNDRRYANTTAFELKQAARVLNDSESVWLVAKVYPAQLNLTLGFNSLDGD